MQLKEAKFKIHRCGVFDKENSFHSRHMMFKTKQKGRFY